MDHLQLHGITNVVQSVFTAFLVGRTPVKENIEEIVRTVQRSTLKPRPRGAGPDSSKNHYKLTQNEKRKENIRNTKRGNYDKSL